MINKDELKSRLVEFNLLDKVKWVDKSDSGKLSISIEFDMDIFNKKDDIKFSIDDREQLMKLKRKI